MSHDNRRRSAPNLLTSAVVACAVAGTAGVSLGASAQATTVDTDGRALVAMAADTAYPGQVRDLRVGTSKDGLKKVVRWKAPKNSGGSPVTGFHVVIRKGDTKLVDREVAGGKRKVVVRTSALKKGKHVVAVAASSAVGTGDVVKRTFKVQG